MPGSHAAPRQTQTRANACCARLIFVLTMLATLAPPALAQGLSCTGFLHGRDGSWRSLEDGPVFGPSGRVSMTAGEVLRPTDRTVKGEIARALNDLCESR